MSDWEELRKLLVNRAVKLNQGLVKSGKIGHWLVDCREVLLVPRGAYLISKLMYERLKTFKSKQVGGLTIAANPITSYMVLLSYQDKNPFHGFIIRKEPKYNGLQKLIEGDFTPGKPVVLVDDLINSGGSIFRAIRNVEEWGCKVEGVITIVNFSNKGLKELRDKGYKAEYLYTLEDIHLRNPKENIEQAKINWSMKCNNWSVHVPRSSPAMYKDTILFGTNEGIFYCLHLDGKELWKFDIKSSHEKGILSSPCLKDDKVYFGAYNGYLYCLNAKTGKVIWKEKRGDWIGSSPTIYKDTLCVGIEYGKKGGVLIACSAKDGKILWHLETRHYIHSSPAIDPKTGTVIVGCNDGYVYAADLKSGKLKWKKNFFKSTKAGFAIEDGLAYFGNFTGSLFCYDLESGKQIWERRLGEIIYATPEIVGNQVICSSVSKRIFSIDKKSGSINWFYNTEKRVNAYTFTENDTTYCGADDGFLYILKKGKLIKKINVGKDINTRPIVHKHRIYLGCRGMFCCIENA